MNQNVPERKEKHISLASCPRARGEENQENLVQGEAIDILSYKKHYNQEKAISKSVVHSDIVQGRKNDKQISIENCICRDHCIDILIKFKVPDFQQPAFGNWSPI